jgi:hypothetical protein
VALVFILLGFIQSNPCKLRRTSMATANVKDSHLNYDGKNYFRGGAEDVKLGSYGEKRTPLTSTNYLEVKGEVPVPNIAKATATVVGIDQNKLSKTDVKVDVKAIVEGVPVKLSPEVAAQKLTNNELKLVKFTVLPNDMEAAVNKSPAALADLKNYGKDARIAHQIFVVMDAKLATKFDNDVTVTLSAGKGPIEAKVGVSHSSSNAATVQISAGTTFAYLLVKIDWNDNKSKVVDLDDDQWSFN